MIKWLLNKDFSLLDTNKFGTCVMNASKYGELFHKVVANF